MPAFLLGTSSQTGQFITVLLIFLFVLFITAATTKWIASFQKEKSLGDNIEILDSKRVAPNKLIEIVRIGDKYFAIGFGKDEITVISEISEDSIKLKTEAKESFSFKDIFNKEMLNKIKDDGEDKDK